MGRQSSRKTGRGDKAGEIVLSDTNLMAKFFGPTGALYRSLELAFERFNEDLFGGVLPAVMVTLQHRGPRTTGYFAPGRFIGRQAHQRLDEIVLNPIHFSAPLATVLANLVHQMAHLWQHGRENPPRPGYHDKSWGTKMKLMGLHPTDTGELGGRETGQRMSQIIVPGCLFQQSMQTLLEDGFEIAWMEALEQKNNDTDKPRDSDKGRVPWHCPKCRERAWAKPTATLACGLCHVPLVRR